MQKMIIVLILHLFNLWVQSPVQAKINGFSINLVHRDSTLSPLYNSSITTSEILRKAVLRSFSRINLFVSSMDFDENKIESVIIPNGGDYLMKIYVGSPPVEILAVADTGSDLIWIQCTPCERCYHQDAPLFDPSKSSTYKELPCSTESCQALPRQRCGSTMECEYFYTYGDRSYTIGILSSETLSLDSSSGQLVSFPSSAFGCGHQNNGAFTSRVAGLVGLGGGPLSLVSQLGTQIENKFSYCLLPSSASTTSKLRFGQDATISGTRVSTALIPRSPNTFYFLTLESVSIGDQTTQTPQSQGNIVIDSGTTLTMLQSSIYNDLEAIAKEAIGVSPVEDPSGTFSLCFGADSPGVNLPEMIFHFTGADLRLPPSNTFILYNDLVCMSIVPTDENFSVFGNIAQVNFQVEYDLQSKQVSFAPADCTKS